MVPSCDTQLARDLKGAYSSDFDISTCPQPFGGESDGAVGGGSALVVAGGDAPERFKFVEDARGRLRSLQARRQWAPRAPAVPADGRSVDPVVPVIDGPLLEIPTKSV